MTTYDRPAALIILDGWGIAPDGPGNAVTQANTPVFDQLWDAWPTSTMTASGEAVGLPDGQMGNSEVGHLNLGAGRIVAQDLMRINTAVGDGTLATNAVLADAVQQATARGARTHIIGLVSTGGVHSHLDHIVAVADAALAGGVTDVIVHAITDGRDVSPTASLSDLPALQTALDDLSGAGSARIGSVIGRYWAMDRDRRWERTKRGYDLFVHGIGTPADSAAEAATTSHDGGTTDEFIEPFTIAEGGELVPRIEPGDLVIYANFRPDRTRQLSHAIADHDFGEFDRGDAQPFELITMTRYDDTLGVAVMFDENIVSETLADVLASHDIGQVHVAETEKYAHVTYFFNGGLEAEHDGESRRLVQSPRDVATYDQKPEMSAHGAADAFVEAFADEAVGFGIINFANPDMVGHTGSIPAAITAIETVDTELARVVEAVHARGGACFITADHGNAEQMLTDDDQPHTAHTTNPVPVIITGMGTSDEMQIADGAILGDVSPTLLDMMGVDQPTAMTGRSLLVRGQSAVAQS